MRGLLLADARSYQARLAVRGGADQIDASRDPVDEVFPDLIDFRRLVLWQLDDVGGAADLGIPLSHVGQPTRASA